MPNYTLTTAPGGFLLIEHGTGRKSPVFNRLADRDRIAQEAFGLKPDSKQNGNKQAGMARSFRAHYSDGSVRQIEADSVSDARRIGAGLAPSRYIWLTDIEHVYA